MFFHEMKTLERVLWLKRIKGSGNPMHEATSTSGSFVTDIIAPLKSLKVTLEPIQSGSGTPSPDNVRPISGHTEVVTEVCGVNVFDEVTEYGRINITTGENLPYSGTRSKNFITIVPNTSYYVKTPDNLYVMEYDANKTFIRYKAYFNNAVYTSSADAYYMRFYLIVENATNISINYPSTDTDYHAYNGQSYTTTLGRTVYGGTLDVVSGELVVDRAIADMGNLVWNKYSDGRFYTNEIVGAKSGSSSGGYDTFICSAYKAENVGSVGSLPNGSASMDGGRHLQVRDDAYTDAPSFKTAVTGQTIAYLLATPQTYQLDPQQINSLVGQNNIIAEDGAEVSEIVYMTRLVGSPQTEEEEANEEPVEESEEPEGE